MNIVIYNTWNIIVCYPTNIYGHKDESQINCIIFIWYNCYGVSKAQGHKIFDKYLLIAFQQGDTCLESKKTLEKVSTCPTNDNAFKERSEKKNCNIFPTCAGKPLFYHCVISEGMLVEVCAPRTLITGILIAHTGIFNIILHVLSKTV